MLACHSILAPLRCVTQRARQGEFLLFEFVFPASLSVVGLGHVTERVLAACAGLLLGVNSARLAHGAGATVASVFGRQRAVASVVVVAVVEARSFEAILGALLRNLHDNLFALYALGGLVDHFTITATEGDKLLCFLPDRVDTLSGGEPVALPIAQGVAHALGHLCRPVHTNVVVLGARGVVSDPLCGALVFNRFHDGVTLVITDDCAEARVGTTTSVRAERVVVDHNSFVVELDPIRTVLISVRHVEPIFRVLGRGLSPRETRTLTSVPGLPGPNVWVEVQCVVL